MKRTARKLSILILAAASISSASYHFIHFNGRTAPWRGIPEKFDVNTLPAKTLTYFITDQTGVQLAPNDSYAGFISQIRAAAKVWSDVETSDLRLAFGGFAAPNSTQSAPSLEIMFEDLSPGLIATGTPTVRADNNGQFVPILHSVVMIRPDLRSYPSFGESLFGTLVHEIGHGLGLQHTFTSGVMSTAITRTTSRSKPLTSDDVAAISMLYPAANFSQVTGSISGRVTMQGAGVNLASVVAISPSGAALSTLTNPDGTYRIEGVPPRAYFIYVHPLPPRRTGQATPGDIVFPRDVEGKELAPSAPFFTIFYPGTNDPSRALTVSPAAGQSVDNVNFTVQARTGYGIHSVDTRAFPGAVAVKPPYLSPSMTYPFIVASGSGLISGNAPSQGLKVSVLGGALLSTKPYSPAPSSYIQIDFDVRTLSFSHDSARHLVFSQGGDIYVLPAAFFHVDRAPPSISSVIASGEGVQRSAILSGTNLTESSRVYFDGVATPVRDFDAIGGRLIVTPPVAAANHRASVVVLNSDGQSSLFLQGDTPSTYTYGSEQSLTTVIPTVGLTPNSLVPGAESMLQIDVAGGALVEGQTTLGFGSSDIVVRNMTVTGPTRILANISVNPGASAGYAQLSLVSGLQLIAQRFAVQVLPPTRSFWLSGAITNAAGNNAPVSAGSTAVLSVGSGPTPLTSSNVTLLLNEKPVPVSAVDENRITFQVPNGTATGAGVLRVEAAGEKSLPILLIVEPPPPKILSAVSAANGLGSAVLAGTPAVVRTGQLLALTVQGLVLPGSVPDPARIGVRLGGVDLRIAQVLEQGDVYRVLVFVSEEAASGKDVPLTISAGPRLSDPLNVIVEAGI